MSYYLKILWICFCCFSAVFLWLPADFPQSFLSLPADFPRSFLSLPADFARSFLSLPPDFLSSFRNFIYISAIYRLHPCPFIHISISLQQFSNRIRQFLKINGLRHMGVHSRFPAFFDIFKKGICGKCYNWNFSGIFPVQGTDFSGRF